MADILFLSGGNQLEIKPLIEFIYSRLTSRHASRATRKHTKRGGETSSHKKKRLFPIGAYLYCRTAVALRNIQLCGANTSSCPLTVVWQVMQITRLPPGQRELHYAENKTYSLEDLDNEVQNRGSVRCGETPKRAIDTWFV